MKYIKYFENNTDKFRDAVIKNDIDKVIEMINNGVEIDTVCTHYHNRTPLCDTAVYDNIELAKILLDHGADVNGNGGELPIFLTDNLYMIKLLVSYGADINMKNKYGETRLMKFSSHYFPDWNILIYFVKNADLSQSYNNGNFLEKIINNKNLSTIDIKKYIKTFEFQNLLCSKDEKNILLIPNEILNKSVAKKYSLHLDIKKFNL